MNNPLLSIIIPTKNRLYTCLFAIESALAIQNDDFEVIVQDCSDTDILRSQIVEKFGQDTRIKYFYTDTKPSMTDNWNMAYDNATGDYQCGIGDDDAVLKEIYEVAKWAKKNKVEAIGQEHAYDYKWPDFEDKTLAGMLIIEKTFTGKITQINSRNLVQQLSKKIDLSYIRLPMVYHCLISNILLNRLIQKTGRRLDSTSLDVYTAFTLGSITQNYYTLSYPFTLRGACGKSNTNRIRKKDVSAHFKEFAHLHWPPEVPPIFNLYTTLTESMYKAFVNTHQRELIKHINFPKVYAYCALTNWNAFNVTILYLLKSNNSVKIWLLFIFEFAAKTIKILLRTLGLTAIFFQKSHIKKLPYSDILNAIEWHRINNKVFLELD